MSWCDKLASTAGVGIKLDKLFVSSSSLLSALAPITSKWVEKDKPAFNVDQIDPFGLQISSFDGFQYSANFESLAVEFKHRLRVKATSAGPPTAEMTSHARPYTELLEEASERLIEEVELITANSSRKVLRIGVISHTVVKQAEAPPGLLRFQKRVTSPWSEPIDAFNIEVTAQLSRAPRASWSERCIHVLSRAEDGEGLMTVRLDWQRSFDAGKPGSLNSLSGLLTSARKAALEYFEDIAEGARFHGDTDPN